MPLYLHLDGRIDRKRPYYFSHSQKNPQSLAELGFDEKNKEVVEAVSFWSTQPKSIKEIFRQSITQGSLRPLISLPGDFLQNNSTQRYCNFLHKQEKQQRLDLLELEEVTLDKLLALANAELADLSKKDFQDEKIPEEKLAPSTPNLNHLYGCLGLNKTFYITYRNKQIAIYENLSFLKLNVTEDRLQFWLKINSQEKKHLMDYIADEPEGQLTQLFANVSLWELFSRNFAASSYLHQLTSSQKEIIAHTTLCAGEKLMEITLLALRESSANDSEEVTKLRIPRSKLPARFATPRGMFIESFADETLIDGTLERLAGSRVTPVKPPESSSSSSSSADDSKKNQDPKRMKL